MYWLPSMSTDLSAPDLAKLACSVRRTPVTSTGVVSVVRRPSASYPLSVPYPTGSSRATARWSRVWPGAGCPLGLPPLQDVTGGVEHGRDGTGVQQRGPPDPAQPVVPGGRSGTPERVGQLDQPPLDVVPAAGGRRTRGQSGDRHDSPAQP